MSNTKPEKTDYIKCRHCGNYAPMHIVAKYYLSLNGEPIASYYYSEPEEGYHYSLLLCLACKEVTLQRYYLHEFMDEMDEESIKVETIYPPEGLKLYHFPHKVQQAYEAALKVRAINANAYATLLGCMLEVVCEDRKAQGKNLYEKFKFLADKGEIPVNLVGVVDGLRKLRNIGTHEPVEGLTSEEIPILDNLSKAILEYIYIAPHLAEQAEMLLEDLNKKRNKESNKNI
ncbi:hypothetical protein RIVM261_077750 [Rivularia sp. IAM M-261]|nr:hypothetical protein RIVM261_077750 [Rivularia sp. IAM M-261]